ncbi:MAG: HU family DNA-binding protein [Planctomycetota bacterium]|jgi:DNA-binding protein HU-beta|nr:HU family DNA-binding protein [Planctomycetota bacterium]
MAVKVEIYRKRQLAQALVEKTGAKLKFAVAAVDFIFDEVAQAVAKGVKVNIKDFGIFVRAPRKARTGRNPLTGQPIKIKASVKPRFTASKALKLAVVEKKYTTHVDTSALVIHSAPIIAPKPIKIANKTVKTIAKAAKKATAKKKSAKKSK